MTLKNFKQNDWILDFDRCNYFDRYYFFKKSNEKLRVQWLSHFLDLHYRTVPVSSSLIKLFLKTLDEILCTVH